MSDYNERQCRKCGSYLHHEDICPDNQPQRPGNGEDYVPFGEEWIKEVSKLPKRVIIEMLKKANSERIEYRERLSTIQPMQGRDKKEYPIEFIEWYSGESGDTIKSAYSRYQKEIEQGQP